MRNTLFGLLIGGLVVAAGCKNATPLQPGTTNDQTPVVITPKPEVPEATKDPVVTARYRVTFDSTWSAATHPLDFPDSAHYSGLIGGTHSSAVTFWQEGQLATEGIRRMAERGSKQPLDDEVNGAIGAGTAQYLLSGGALGTSPGAISLEFDISSTHPLVTLVTMVAPSPDWFTGVNGTALFQNGQWLDDVRVTVYGWDAGTDSGTTYSSPDKETTPRQPVARLAYPLSANGPAAAVGTVTFVKIG